MATAIPGAAVRARARAATRGRAAAAEALPAAIAIAALDFLLALYLDLHLHYTVGDALSRVANAFGVLYGRDPHLAAIGFIWNPLPSLLDVPILLFVHLWPPLAQDGVAGLIVTAAFSGIAVYYLVALLGRFSVPWGWRVSLALLFAANPMVALYSANGMSDMMLAGALLAVVHYTLGYLEDNSLGDLVAAGVWLAIAFGVRYEAGPLGICLAFGLFVALRRQHRRAREVRGAVLILLAPLFYAAAIWVYLNWLIMKNPLYFLNGNYSNNAQTSLQGNIGAVAGASHHILHALLLVGQMGLLFWPVFLGLAAAAAIALRRRGNPSAWILIGATVGMPLLQAALLYLGHSGGWARYFIYYIPNGVLLLAFAAAQLPGRRLRGAALVLVAVLCVLGDIGTYHEEVTSPVVGLGETSVVQELSANRPLHLLTADDQVVRYLDAHPHLSVLVDAFRGFPIELRLAHPAQLIITPDVNFQSVLENPLGRVDAILVPAPQNLGLLDAVNRTWPKLWAGKMAWVHLLKEFPGPDDWRLYAVGPNAP